MQWLCCTSEQKCKFRFEGSTMERSSLFRRRWWHVITHLMTAQLKLCYYSLSSACLWCCSTYSSLGLHKLSTCGSLWFNVSNELHRCWNPKPVPPGLRLSLSWWYRHILYVSHSADALEATHMTPDLKDFSLRTCFKLTYDTRNNSWIIPLWLGQKRLIFNY